MLGFFVQITLYNDHHEHPNLSPETHQIGSPIFFAPISISMNRIRQSGAYYQVLVTPYQKYNTGFEFLLGSWTDEALTGFEVRQYRTFAEAENIALDFPDINWVQLVEFHRDNYVKLRAEIKTIVDHSGLVVGFKPTLLSPMETKNKMFDRVASKQNGQFRLVYQMNDIISFVITNPWSRNLVEMEQQVLSNANLRIFKRFEKNKIVHLVGRTDIGTTYEICLMPCIMENWIAWKEQNRDMPRNKMLAMLKQCIDAQTTLDHTQALR